jgi:hypothetical protein
MFFDAGAQYIRIRVADIHDLGSETVAGYMPNLDKAGKSRILRNAKIDVHPVADIHGGAGEQVYSALAYVHGQTKIG